MSWLRPEEGAGAPGVGRADAYRGSRPPIPGLVKRGWDLYSRSWWRAGRHPFV